MNVGVPCTGPVANNAPVGFCVSHAARDELSELLGRGLLKADMNRQDGVDRSFGQAANLDLAMICHEEGGGIWELSALHHFGEPVERLRVLWAACAVCHHGAATGSVVALAIRSSTACAVSIARAPLSAPLPEFFEKLRHEPVLTAKWPQLDHVFWVSSGAGRSIQQERRRRSGRASDSVEAFTF
jgi:hypothetical protein